MGLIHWHQTKYLPMDPLQSKYQLVTEAQFTNNPADAKGFAEMERLTRLEQSLIAAYKNYTNAQFELAAFLDEEEEIPDKLMEMLPKMGMKGFEIARALAEVAIIRTDDRFNDGIQEYLDFIGYEGPEEDPNFNTDPNTW